MTYYSNPYAFPAPADSDPVATYASIARALVDKIDDDLGLDAMVTVTTGFVAAAGWTMTSFRGRKILGGKAALVDIVATRNAGAAVITATATGNITDTDVAALPAAWRPTRRQYVRLERSSVSSWQGFIDSNAAGGMWTVTAGYPTATISPGDAVQTQQLIWLE